MKAVVVRPVVVWGGREMVGGEFSAQSALPRFVPSFASSPLGTYCVDTTDRTLSLTYDDGPNPDDTPRILELLAERGRAATFYVLGQQVKQHPRIVRRIVDEGHELALHGDTHDSLLTMSALTAVRRIRDAKALVEDVAGTRLRTYRPPYGEHTLAQAVGIRALGLRLVNWSGDAVDWIDDEESAVAERSLAGVFPGAILLLHDHRGDPEKLEEGQRLPAFDRAAVLRRILDGLDEREYETLAVKDLLAKYVSVRTHIRY
ncbi:polysaccharide deacetylase family protein [Microbacterium immunditiarum]|uniref:Peptidoglycan/xylan/chitin deacetylase (PgdA/CDA1 family) n=1 Tax=Microbacterium immunditiarum TaxID=337480 RepID=A0A7Y9GNN3_9MICO|nr:polysaccharide deacetylase family protein [Microbacterium immunditiarum]NYE18725.1 peptidoglycan/xylan/chitin deacetylase (PgdA/CDA1 family) [Microbacterium immunditiarum]